jgi:adenylate kinase family enzyme
MSDYDFKPLNDKEFEVLCCDLIGQIENHRFERFKAGRDGGVDGRYFSDSGNEVVLQCKHWVNTPVHQLLRSLQNEEKVKLDRLKPSRYILAISNPVSRSDKQAISHALAPHVKSDSDIYGKQDLNDILRRHSHIENRHYKLWLHSVAVLGFIFNNAILGRSAFSLEEIVRTSSTYVVTKNHEAALRILERLGVVIITGEPGVGKTTLADHLCLHYAVNDFQYIKIVDDVKEAESIFVPDKKQIIYFDDFLGRNYLDALRGNEGNYVTQFIRRVMADKSKRFVLTSRSTILNQGKFLIDNLEHNNIEKNEYELRIQSYTELDKAQILYNHIWHSGLEPAYVEQIYIERRYRQVIAHKNFNPRLISYVTDSTRLESCAPDNYWGYLLGSLRYPAQVWENPFLAQQDDFCRALVILVVLNGHAIHEDVLARAYHRYVALPENQSLRGRGEFQSNIRLLTGSFLNRNVRETGAAVIDLFNPSIGDYVLERYGSDDTVIRMAVHSLQSSQSVVTLRSLRNSERISPSQALAICAAVVKNTIESEFEGVDAAYIAWLFDTYLLFSGDSGVDSSSVAKAVKFILSKGNSASKESLGLVYWGVKKDVATSEEAIKFLSTNMVGMTSDDEIKAAWRLLDTVPDDTAGLNKCADDFKNYILEMISENLEEFIDVNDAFAEAGHGEDWVAVQELEKLLEWKLSYLGIPFVPNDINEIVDSYDVSYELERYYERSSRDEEWEPDGPLGLAVDEIDDLFDRG